MRRLAAILAALALPLVVLAPMSSAAPPALIYSAHVSSLGWLPDVASPATGLALLTAVDAAAARTALGLGTAATTADTALATRHARHRTDTTT